MRVGVCATTALVIAGLSATASNGADPPYNLPFKAPKGFAPAGLDLGDNEAFVPRRRARVHSTGRLPYLAIGCPNGCSVRLSVTLTSPRTPVRAASAASVVHQIAAGRLAKFVTRFTRSQLRAVRRAEKGTIRVKVKLRDADGLHRGTLRIPIR
jgi:hypothetical protein